MAAKKAGCSVAHWVHTTAVWKVDRSVVVLDFSKVVPWAASKVEMSASLMALYLVGQKAA
jgi:hypothetical protein